MLLVEFENFSKWVELAAVRKATTEIVIKVLREKNPSTVWSTEKPHLG